MHIAVNGWFWNHPETGSGQYTRQLIQRLVHVTSGCHVTVFVPHTGTQPLPQRETHAGYTLVYVTAKTSSLYKVWWEQVTIPRLARSCGADILHIPYWAAPIRSKLPIAVTIHDLIPLILPAYRGSLLVRLYTALVSATSRGATIILTDSDASRRDILAHLPVTGDKVHTVYLAADASYQPQAHEDDVEIRRHYGLPEQYVLYLGGFDNRKNLAMLMQAFGYVLHSLPDEKLVVAGKLPRGDSAFAPDPRVQAQAAGLPEQALIFPGFVDEAHKAAILRGAQVFVFPSLYEGFGLPPLEAMHCGTPVVGCNRSSIPEVAQQGGILVEPDDVQGMAGAIIQLLNDDAFHASLRQQALEQAQQFSWQNTATITLEIFDALPE